MALALFAAVALIASFDDRILNSVFLVICAGVSLWSLRRYLYLLMHAEEMAHQTNCTECKAYGLLRLLDPQDRRRPTRAPVPVCCKRCGFRWSLEDS